MTARNLIIIFDPRNLDHKDFEEIGQLILAKRAKIQIYLFANDYDIANDPRVDWRLPTLTVSLCHKVKSEPRRGYVLFCRQIDKLAQIEVIKAAGLRVPMSSAYDPSAIYDSAEWGDFVIVKSRRLEGTSVGQSAYVTPTQYIGQPELLDDPVKSILLSGHAMVQEFVPTGPHPSEHRASMFLGRVLYLMRGHSMMKLPELDPNSRATFVFDSKFEDPEKAIKRSRMLIDDPDVMEFAQKIAKVFPGIPLMGVDILKHEKTGDLYALELNSGGNTWHFSAPSTADARLQVSREQRIAQFGAWDLAAEALVEHTLKLAQ